jgi:hypothetical protein
MPPKKSTKQTSVLNSHDDLESNKHSLTMGETLLSGKQPKRQITADDLVV